MGFKVGVGKSDFEEMRKYPDFMLWSRLLSEAGQSEKARRKGLKVIRELEILLRRSTDRIYTSVRI